MSVNVVVALACVIVSGFWITVLLVMEANWERRYRRSVALGVRRALLAQERRERSADISTGRHRLVTSRSRHLKAA